VYIILTLFYDLFTYITRIIQFTPPQIETYTVHLLYLAVIPKLAEKRVKDYY